MKDKLIQLFKTDSEYREQQKQYGKRDGILAVALFVLMMLLYYIGGRVYYSWNLYLGVQINLCFIAVVLGLVIFCRQTPESIGFHSKRMGKSFLLGLILGLVYLTASYIVPGIYKGASLAPVGYLASRLVYYLFIIALTEELVFRSYIMPRLYGLLKNGKAALLLSGLFFALMHIPFQMGMNGMGLFAFCAENWLWLLLLFGWHLVFAWLYQKYNSIIAPAIFHTLMDFGDDLFR